MELVYKKSSTVINGKFREFLLPTVLAAVAAQLGSIINGIIAGNLISSKAMAAISACMPLVQITYAVAVLIALGSSALISIAAGARDNAKADYIFSSIIFTSVFVAAVSAVFLIPNTYEISKFLSSVEDLRVLIHDYLIVLVWRTPLILISFAWQAILRTEGLAKVLSRGVVIGQVTNVILSFILISHGLGVKGAGIALVTSDLITFAYIMKIYYSSSERSRKFSPIFNDVGKLLKQIFELIKSGVPASCSIGLISVKVWAIYQILGATGGSDAMTLYAVCMACLSINSMFTTGCNGAMMPIVGMLYGEKDFVGVRILVKYVLKFALCLSGIFVAFEIIFPQVILEIYNVPESLFADGATALRLFSISLLGVTLTFLMMYYYSTVQRRVVANILSFTEGIIVVIPAAWVLSKIFGLTGVWLAFILAELSGFLMIWIYSKYTCKKSDGKLNDIFLIEKAEPNLIYDVSTHATIDDATKISAEAIRVLENENAAKNISNRVGVALEEMIINIEKTNPDKKIDVDVRIKSELEKVIIAIRDNGKSFNPLEYQSHENFKIDNIMVLKSITKNIQYNRTLSLNQTVIEI